MLMFLPRRANLTGEMWTVHFQCKGPTAEHPHIQLKLDKGPTVAVDLNHPSCIQRLKSHLKLDGQCSATFLEEVSESTAGDWGQAEE